jgi:hypothetical protein
MGNFGHAHRSSGQPQAVVPEFVPPPTQHHDLAIYSRDVGVVPAPGGPSFIPSVSGVLEQPLELLTHFRIRLGHQRITGSQYVIRGPHDPHNV